MKVSLKCIGCGETFSAEASACRCPRCGDLLDIVYDYGEVNPRLLKEKWLERRPGVWKYKELMPLQPSNPVTLGEGGTTLHSCGRLAKALGMKNLYAKNEGENPTGSFKDRGMTVGVNKALELGMKITACASTGNTSASLSAYAAKAGLGCVVLLPAGKIASGKLAQAIAHGARVIAVKGNFDDALVLVQNLCQKYSLYLLNSINPFRLEGQKTIAYEVYEQLGSIVPDTLIVPVGNAGNISAIWKGFSELEELRLVDEAPRMVGVQAEGASPFASMILEKRENLVPVSDPKTIATAIRIGAPVNWKKALRAVKESDGTVVTVTDVEIVEAQKSLARSEGLFVEPASAASVAGLRKLIERGDVSATESVVCVLTGHGLKDPEIVSKYYEKPVEIENDVESVERQLQKLFPDECSGGKS